jgi:hypothetical protein
MASNDEKKVQVPGAAVNPQGDDIGEPAAALLHELALLGTETEYDNASKLFSGSPPQSIAIIEAGVTRLTKVWAVLAAAGVSITAVWAAIGSFWAEENDSVRVATLAAAGVVLAVLVVALAWLITSDVKSRAGGAIAQIQARAAVTTSYLNLLARAPSTDLPPDDSAQTEALLAALGAGLPVTVQLANGSSGRVNGVRHDSADGLQVHVKGSKSDWIAVSRVTSFSGG